MKRSILLLAAAFAPVLQTIAQEEAGGIDASDPTKVYTYAGPGIKYTDFNDGGSLTELRVTGNLGLSDSDMILFEAGYGSYDGTPPQGVPDSGLTNMRARWFHLFNMDHTVVSGYRGWATQIDLQLEGDVQGTRGSNTVAIGALPAFGINAEWAFYLPVNYVSTWNRNFNDHTGHGASVAPMLAWAPEKGLWPGFFVQFWPSYTRYFSGNLDGEGGANVDITVGGSPSETVVVTAVFQKNFDKNFEGFRRPGAPPGANDWNVFVSASWYF